FGRSALGRDEPIRRRGERAEPARKVAAAGDRRHDLRGRAAECAVAGDEAREGRGNERLSLKRDPALGPDPADSAHLRARVPGLAARAAQRDLAYVGGEMLVALAWRAALGRDHLDQPWHER